MHLPLSWNPDEPCCITDSAQSVTKLLTDKTIKQILTGWGGRYKRQTMYEKEEKASMTLQTRQGKEQVEDYFSALASRLKTAIDMSSISQQWNKTSWLTGYSPTFQAVGTTPNSGAIATHVLRVPIGNVRRLAAERMSKCVPQG